MESLALLVTLLLLADISMVGIAVGLSFVDNKIARGFTIAFSAIPAAFSLYVAIATKSQGSWIMALVVFAIGAFAIWNSFRVR